MKCIYCLLLLLCPLLNRAQPPNIKPLTIGGKMPGIVFTQLLNGNRQTISVTAFKDKLLILDFWATWCSNCIREFPKLQALQKQFGNQLQVLLVNNTGSGDTEQKIKRCFQDHRNTDGTAYNLPVILNDTTWSQLFPHSSLPHTAWIYKGKLLAVTGAEELTAENISAVLKNGTVSLQPKQDVVNINTATPFLTDTNSGVNTALLSRTVFSGYLKGLGSKAGRYVNADSTLLRLYYINQPLGRLYSIAAGALPANRIILGSSLDKGLFQQEGNNGTGLFCYELTVPYNSEKEQLYARLRSDLNTQFGLQTFFSKIDTACYILVQTPGAATGFKEPGAANDSVAANKERLYSLRNRPLSSFLSALNGQQPVGAARFIVIDETGYGGKATLQIPLAALQDITSLQKALQPWGLSLVPATRNLSFMLITKAPANAGNNMIP